MDLFGTIVLDLYKARMAVKGVRESQLSDIPNFVPRLRSEDLEEISCHSGRRPEESLYLAFFDPGEKRIYSIMDGERVLGMFGVRTVRSDSLGRRVGAPWMLCSDELIEKFRWKFLAEHRDWLERIEDGYSLLESHVYAKNLAHIEWLKWVGFELVEYVESHGVAEVPFWRFQKKL